VRRDRLLFGCGKSRTNLARKTTIALLIITSCTARERPATNPAATDRDSLLQQARQDTREGALDPARLRYEVLLARDPLDDEARTGLAKLDAWEGEHAKAERAYREVLSRHPRDDDVRAGLFNVLVWNQRWQDAADLLNAAPKHDSPTILGLRARLAYVDGDVTEGRRLAERAEQLAPQDGELRELRQRLTTRFARVTSRLIVTAQGAPMLGQAEVSLSQSIHRLRLTFDTEQGSRPLSLTSGWVYGATYGGGAWWTFAPGIILGTEFAMGAPAAMVPLIRARAQFSIPWRPWLDMALSYQYRRYAQEMDTHGSSASLGLTLRGEIRIDATYWLTQVQLHGSADDSGNRWLQAFGLSAGRTMFPGFDVRAGYAHGAEAERAPTIFQLLDLVNDSFFVGLKIRPNLFFSIEPLYGLALRGHPGGARQVQHTFEVGVVLKQ
jgi:tetratricopeptide (TPR) repeat protein